jgi:hypothetical protein
MTSFLEE